MRSVNISPDLGAFSILPREIRDRIYSYALKIEEVSIYDEPDHSMGGCECCMEHQGVPLYGILLTSKRIYEEASIVFFQNTRFLFLVERDYNNPRENCSITGRKGWRLSIRLGRTLGPNMLEIFTSRATPEMIKHMQNISFNVGILEGIWDGDICTEMRRSIHGPERPTYITLLKVLKDACTVLKTCHQIHHLQVSVRSAERSPGAIEDIMDPIRNLRGIKACHIQVWNLQTDQWVDWQLKPSYGRYMTEIMSLPEGSPTPKYVGDEEDPDQTEDDIFDTIEARWSGGPTFSFGYSEDEFDPFMEDDEDLMNELIDNDEFYDGFQAAVAWNQRHHER